MTKVVGLEGGKKKSEDKCMFCGAEPACFAWTCKRLKAVSVDDVGWGVEFWPDEPEDAE